MSNGWSEGLTPRADTSATRGRSGTQFYEAGTNVHPHNLEAGKRDRREKRRGPALPGLTYSTPLRISIAGRCEWPAMTA